MLVETYFKKEDIGLMADIVEPDFSFLDEKALSFLENDKTAITLSLDGRPIFCGGVLLKSENRGEIWAVLDKKAARYAKSIHKRVKEIIEKLPIERLEAKVKRDFDAGHRWVKALGFNVVLTTDKYVCYGKDKVPALQDFKTKVQNLEDTLRGLPQEEGMTLKHHFTKGLYARELFIPAGTMLVGKIHKHENLNILSQGKISVATEDGVVTLEAPATIVSKAGTKRAGYAHTDCVWTSIHATEETDLEKIEAEVIAESYDKLEGAGA